MQSFGEASIIFISIYPYPVKHKIKNADKNMDRCHKFDISKSRQWYNLSSFLSNVSREKLILSKTESISLFIIL